MQASTLAGGNRIAGLPRQLVPIITVVVFLTLWTAASTYLINPAVLPPPARILNRAMSMLASGELPAHVLVSLKRVLIGYSLGSVTAIVLGLLMGRIRAIRAFIDPLFEFCRPISPTAIIPLAIMWFGIGEPSKWFVISYATFFIVAISTMGGVASTPLQVERAALSLGATERQVFLYVVIPSAIPHVLIGLRSGIGLSFMSIVAAEMIAAREGMGFLIDQGRMLLQTERIFVGLVALGVVGLVIDRLFRALQNRLFQRYLFSIRS